MPYALIWVYLIPAIVLVGGMVLWRSHQARRAARALLDAEQSGLTEPASLHPLIQPAQCIGCGACVKACPEGDVLGLIQGKAHLVNPSDCIGHGACASACPVGAIELVFGSSKRGVDIPVVSPAFESTQPGIYIAGELGGMGLIRNAVEQGRQAMEAIGASLSGRSPEGQDADVVIIGAGPAGISASLQARLSGIRAITLEQETLGGTVAHFPKGKIVMTQPMVLPGEGRINLREVSKEALLALWKRVIDSHDLDIRYGQRVTAIERCPDGFQVMTQSGECFRAPRILLAIGRRGTPRKLGIPGEALNHVVYRLADPEQYAGQRVLVVGGGDSALEAACSIAEVPDTTVTLCYRGEAFTRAKRKNRERVSRMQAQGRLSVRFRTQPEAIEPGRVWLISDGQREALDNDAVIICAGGILPFDFLRRLGLQVETKYGTA
ncbi:MAG: 4Fe-4S dicluster domain-containing protein [Gammaproteobacteria bacterium]|nr:MAG: 4Fe-4S dicluster domain-containing protein [Gammaproteobacteria bacterium]